APGAGNEIRRHQQQLLLGGAKVAHQMSGQYRLLVGGMPGVGLGGWVGDPLGLAPVPVYPVVAQGPVEGRLLDRLQIGAALMPQAMRPELAPDPLLGPRAGAADHVTDG